MARLPLRVAGFCLVLFGGLGAGCYSELPPSSAYRYACDGDGDCSDNEMCRRGVCERPCSQATAAEDCPSEDGYATCFNGACVNTCEVGAGYCPPAHECLDLGLSVGVGGNNPFGGGNAQAAIGICGIMCDADSDDICPDGEVCLPNFGTCAVDCSQGQACPDGFDCIFGVCAPLDAELPPADDDGGSDSATDGGESTGDGSDGDGSSGAVGPAQSQER